MVMFDYWKLKRAYNTLELKYETLQSEAEYKDRVITRLKNENKKLKEEKKYGNSCSKKRKRRK